MEVKRRPLLERLRYVLTEQEEIEVKANAAEVARSHDAILHLTREVERLREENERLTGDRQNLELVYQQLNRTHESCLGDRDREFDRRVAAEAKLAKVVEAWGALQDSLMLAREYEASSSPTEREALRTLDSIAAAKGE